FLLYFVQFCQRRYLTTLQNTSDVFAFIVKRFRVFRAPLHSVSGGVSYMHGRRMLKLRKARIPSVPKEPPGCTALTSTTASDKQRATKKGEHYVHPFFIIRRSL
ncbi:hypothetical protein ACB272_22625, partial [Klebsiella pneumoniae]